MFFYHNITLSCYFRCHRVGSQLKMSERQTKAGNQITLSLSHRLYLCHSLTLVILNNFCFHVYDKSLSHSHTLSQYLTLSMSHSHTFTLPFTHSPHADSFFFITMLKSHSHTLSLFHSHSFSLSHSFNLSFTHSRHAEQLLFSCLGSNVTLHRWKCQCFFLTATPSPVTLDVIELVPS